MNFENAHMINFDLNAPHRLGQAKGQTPRSAAHARAELHRFRAPLPKILKGDYQRAVKDMQTSLCRQGLITPLIVSRTPAAQAGSLRPKRKLIVMDGHKRLIALRRLAFEGRLPASLMTVPYIFANSAAIAREMPCLQGHKAQLAETIAA